MTFQIANVVLASLIAGGMLIVQLAIVPTIHRLPEPLGIRLHVAVDPFVEYHLPAFTVLTFLTGIGVLVFNDDLSTVATVLVIAGLVATAAVALLSQLFNRPMNQVMGRWEPGTVPPEYGPLRRRWDRFHIARTSAGLAALLCFMIALLVD